jgi:hypothetical protein
MNTGCRLVSSLRITSHVRADEAVRLNQRFQYRVSAVGSILRRAVSQRLRIRLPVNIRVAVALALPLALQSNPATGRDVDVVPEFEQDAPWVGRRNRYASA